MLAFVGTLAIFGVIATTQFARTNTAVIGTVAIVIVAIFAGLFGRIKNVL